MTENVVNSKDVTKKRTVTKKTTTSEVKEVAETTVEESAPKKKKDDRRLVIFESGSSYSMHGYRFDKQNRIQLVPNEIAEVLLSLSNFRLPTQEEVDNFSRS